MAPLPSAGVLWHPLAFALGFRELGHDVWLFEDSGDYPWGYDPEEDADDPTCLAGARFLQRELPGVGLGDRWAYRHVPTGEWRGHGDLGLFADADVFVNVSLTTPRRPEYERVPHRVAVDTDPVFTQVRIANGDPQLVQVPEWHTRLFTFGRPPLPAQAHEWVPTRQPIVTTGWPEAPPPSPDDPLTTVTTWRAYPPVTWGGVEYAAKDRSILGFLDLPSRTDARLRFAVGAGLDREHGVGLLADHGWELADPVAATRSTAAYRGFMAASLGEICFAKHGYVAARSGWFSERTCLYLLTGRPALVQQTGWADWLPEGEGLLSFSTMDEAVAGIDELRSDPARHARAARKLVEEHFAAADVCQGILDAL
jgi:hypothetical protein